MFENCDRRVLSEEYFDFILDYEIDENTIPANSGVCYTEISPIFKALYVPVMLVPSKVLDVYGYKIFVRLFGLLDMSSLEASNITRLHYNPNLNVTGQGVLIGIIDTGIDYTHNAFRYADGTTRIVSIWDQTIQEGQPPTDLVFGTEYSRDQINTALKSGNPSEIVPSKDDVGHGTFLAGIAAGNEDSYNSFSGVATDSELVIVKLKQTKQNLRELYRVPKDAICFQENDIMLGIKYLLSVAQNLGRPLSICIGLGTSQGGHDGRGALGLYLSIINNMEGIAVSVAAGNEGNTRRHYEGFLITGVDKETVELNVGPKEPGFGMEIWSDIPSTFSIELYSPTGEYVPIITPRLGERRTVRFFFNSTTIEIYFQLLGSRSGSQLVILFFDHPGAGIWRMVINKISRNIDLRYHIWLPMRNFLNEKTYFINSSPFTTLTSPADSNALIVATAYNSLNDSIAPEASRGYTRYGEIVPHFAAPGVGLIGPGQANSYSVRSGTSIAAAHTAGVAAMLLEWGIIKGHLRSMNGIDIKNMLLIGADRDIGGPYPNREWGYGLLDVYGAFERLSGQ